MSLVKKVTIGVAFIFCVFAVINVIRVPVWQPDCLGGVF